MRMAILIGLGVVVAVLGGFYAIGVWRTASAETVAWDTLAPLPGGEFITTASGRTHYVDVGEGPAIILFHGSGRSVADWQQGAIERLARHHRVIAFDYFGMGFSERNPSFTYGYDLWITQALELLDALGVEKVTAIGHSVGGVLACILAADHAERVDHVVTIGTGMTIEPQQWLLLVPGLGETIMATSENYGGAQDEAHREAMAAAYRVIGTRAALLAYARRQATVDGMRLLFGTFEDVKAPVLHLSGARDVNIDPKIAEALTARTRGKFVLIDGATHGLPMEVPDRFAEEVEKFLGTSPGA